MTTGPAARGTGEIAQVLRLMLGAALALIFVWLAGNVLLLIFAGLLVGLLFRVPAEWVAERTGIGPRLALVPVATALLLALAIGVWLVAPRAAEQFTQLGQQLPGAWERALDALKQLGIPRSSMPTAGDALSTVSGRTASSAASSIVGAASVTIGVLADVVIIIAMGAYLAVEPRIYLRGLLELVPIPRRDRWHEILLEVEHVLAHWLLGQLASMCIISTLLGLGLWLLGVPLALTLALIAGLLTFIPNLGPILALLPALLLGFGQGPWQALYVFLLYAAVQFLESYLVTPLIQRRAIHMPPALIFAAQILMGVLAGIIGLALATPLLAATLTIVRMAYVEDRLGDRAEAAPD
jgi:predicted PurR-regulated permease PerM